MRLRGAGRSSSPEMPPSPQPLPGLLGPWRRRFGLGGAPERVSPVWDGASGCWGRRAMLRELSGQIRVQEATRSLCTSCHGEEGTGTGSGDHCLPQSSPWDRSTTRSPKEWAQPRLQPVQCDSPAWALLGQATRALGCPGHRAAPIPAPSEPGWLLSPAVSPGPGTFPCRQPGGAGQAGCGRLLRSSSRIPLLPSLGALPSFGDRTVLPMLTEARWKK